MEWTGAREQLLRSAAVKGTTALVLVLTFLQPLLISAARAWLISSASHAMMAAKSGCRQGTCNAEATMRRYFLAAITLGLVLAASLSGGLSPAQAGEATEWAAGVPYHTDYEQAIKLANETGRILLIYNGWQRDGI